MRISAYGDEMLQRECINSTPDRGVIRTQHRTPSFETVRRPGEN